MGKQVMGEWQWGEGQGGGHKDWVPLELSVDCTSAVPKAFARSKAKYVHFGAIVWRTMFYS